MRKLERCFSVTDDWQVARIRPPGLIGHKGFAKEMARLKRINDFLLQEFSHKLAGYVHTPEEELTERQKQLRDELVEGWVNVIDVESESFLHCDECHRLVVSAIEKKPKS